MHYLPCRKELRAEEYDMSDHHQEAGLFEITTAQAFFEKAIGDYNYFYDNITNSSAAMNCILSLYHLHEWVWHT